MKPTSYIAKSDELSLELKNLLKRANLQTFFELSRKTRLGLRTVAPNLKVRHLAHLEAALATRGLHFYPDDSILLDHFIDQRKLFNLWQKGIFTYRQLDKLPYEQFVEALGGPHSRFFRQKKASMRWLIDHGMEQVKSYKLPHLTEATVKLLFAGDVRQLKDLVTLSDFDIAKKLQPGFGENNTKATPTTRARLAEIKYALYKEGIERPCQPL